MWILLHVVALSALALAQQDCSQGACYPSTGDLLIGRATQLKASSTCGMTGIEVFCTPLGQWKMKCCPCDSKNPYGQNAHQIQNVVAQAGPNRWWQSRKDVNPVSLQFDTDSKFLLHNLVLDFKGPRPEALVVERSLDFGRTWQPFLYLASDCRTSFPQISTSPPRSLQDVQCHTMPPLPPNSSYQDQTVHISPIRQVSAINLPQSQKIERLSGFTNLRLNLTRLGQPPRISNARAPSAFYALKKMQVQGSCFCHGHANRCVPTANQLPGIQVHSVCDCQHNTAGVNCERCADLYNDLPWRPAEERNPHQCKKCECNNHAQRCRFDPVVYEASRMVSGGVCENCQHHTTGRNCEKCTPFYYRNPQSTISRQDACLRCQCSVEGAERGGQCDPETGACFCKANVEGPRCDRCKAGYYGLSASDPQGCKKCSCSVVGSVREQPCDPLTGQCQCLPNFIGLTCDRCAPNYWNPFSRNGCEPCKCDPRNSYGTSCNQLTGQCECRPGFGGRTCTECPDNSYGDLRTRCLPCNCDPLGTVRAGCDKTTGACLCQLGVTGPRCDHCQRGHCDRYPSCPLCPSCFFSLDREMQGFSNTLDSLSKQAMTLPGSSDQDLGPRILGIESTLQQMRDRLPYPPPSDGQITEAISTLHRLRDQASRLNPDFFLVDQSTSLNRQIDSLQTELGSITLQYTSKRDSANRILNGIPTGALSTIQSAYQESADAIKKAEGTKVLVDQSASQRGDAAALEGQIQQGNKKALEKLNSQLATRPDLTPTAAQVCGSTRSTPCTPVQCDGQLCPGPSAPPCGNRATCTGALPLGNKAMADTEETRSRLRELSSKIQRAAAEIQNTQDSANRVRQSTDKLANQIKQARRDLDKDMQDTRDFVQQLREFLSDPDTDPEAIQTVSEEVLNTKLPQSLDALRSKVDEIRRIAAGLPDSRKVLESTGPELDHARELLRKAETARTQAVLMEENVNQVLDTLTSEESSLRSLETNVQDTMRIVDGVKNNINEIEGLLNPAQKTLGELAVQMDQTKPQLTELRDLVQSTQQLAQQAGGDVSRAQSEANEAGQELLLLEGQYKELMRKWSGGAGQSGGGASSTRLQELQQEANDLILQSMSMMRTLSEREGSLLEANEELLIKSRRLEGMEEELQKILDDIRQKARVLNTCQG
uniref:Laminin subunit beta 3 n=1 Tax=Lepisosteus oculatus TaxID=7918 RepID=W5MZY8_LEPOC|nr:PREDICTED: laminin subunit beta-3 [Lepisosteus oculatus]XP_015198237.1 PREDICTED: laminin subunit beta-3 [Lepisosteus oculatus]